MALGLATESSNHRFLNDFPDQGRSVDITLGKALNGFSSAGIPTILCPGRAKYSCLGEMCTSLTRCYSVGWNGKFLVEARSSPMTIEPSQEQSWTPLCTKCLSVCHSVR